MDIESLKLILDAVEGISGSATSIAIVWMLEGYFTTLVGWGAVIWLAKIFSKFIPYGKSDAALMEIRDALGVGSTGVLADYEIRDVKERVFALQRQGRE